MVITFKCSCGNTDPRKVHIYEGLLGYEALICKVCGRYYTHEDPEPHEADEFSLQFVD